MSCAAEDWPARSTRSRGLGRLGWPTPGLSRSSMTEWSVAAEHLAERYRQFFIIALGELILVTALTLGRSDFAADQSAAFVVSIATTVLLWRIYIYRAGEVLAAAIEASPTHSASPSRRHTPT
ncbi:low temperature requirement protein A [Micromonospora sicca]|uniref:low temperature requirement protein A n=1 Tax=Micromonospora sicca TaxID=2202420 RepID=UPI00137537BB|nr:low temperature requirement protein A [Micromonospora sp. 4G51]